MSDKQQFLIYVDFGEYTYKYLFITGLIPYPEWPEDDERWLTYDERGEAVERFKLWAEKHISGLSGKVVLVESCDYVVADGYREQS